MGGGALFEAPAANLLSMLAIELGKGTVTMTVHAVCSFAWLFAWLHFEWLFGLSDANWIACWH